MYSSRMRSVRCSGRLGGVSNVKLFMVFGVLAATINVIHSKFMAYTVIKQGEAEIPPNLAKVY